MLPIKITISGFCSYMGETTIEFEKLGTNGIYLITGDTGSGKTAIFDAIKYALYGKSSNNNRDALMLRNTKAPNTTPTFVDFDFQIHGKLYNIKRNPTYTRASKRGSGTTEESASVCLTLPDKTTNTSISSVAKEIVKILGVNDEQFSQITMIAQGEFQKLLTASTLERSTILRHIFKTEKYNKVQQELKEKAKELKVENENLRISIEKDFKNIILSDDESIDPKLSDSKKIEEIETLISKNKATLANYKQDLVKENNSLLSITSAKTSLEGQLTTYDSYNEEIQDKIKEDSILKTVKDKLKNEKEKEKQRKDLANSIKKLDQSLPKYLELDDLNCKLTKATAKKKNNETELTKQTGILNQKKNSLQSKKDQFDNLKDTSTKHEIAKNNLERLTNKNASFSECFDLIKLYKSFDVTGEQAKLKEIYKDFKIMSDNYKQLFTTFFASQAGILAKDLKENTPCKVCGSTNHPNKATLPPNAPTESELNEAKDNLDDITNQATAQSEYTSKLIQDQSNTIKNVCTNVNKILSTTYDESVDITIIEDALNLELSNLNSDLINVNDEIKVLKNNLTIFNNLLDEIPTLEPEIEEINKDISSIVNDININKNDITNSTDAITKIGTLDFPTHKIAENSLNSLKQQLKVLEDTLETAKTKYNDQKNKVAGIDGRIELLKGQLDGILSLDDLKTAVNNKENDFATTKNNIEKLEILIKNSNDKRHNNLFYLKNLNKNLELLKISDIETADVEQLSVCANGKITLETKVQQAFFDNIIARANQRFFEMSNGEYNLVRQETSSGNAKAGLDLDVIDMSDGQRRSVRSLSGGESFKASISLALGLSDEIQSNAGGIELGALFIDEGFGTLDSETLNVAMDILQKLSQSGKVIGLISHVEKLKQRIDKQIIVQKSLDIDGLQASNVTIQY